eukprot:TRINITY_DN5352_c0_g1_i1.p1 TRINITY_DN5352_c0_g1~~TRINITY_DN5352_c0_g1_i1.p1  ORF type:complete len:360 (+),score=142.98 TRINITY_DN5352_c0_g1_i1:200-1279(+)
MRKKIILSSCDEKDFELDDKVLSFCSTIKNMAKGRDVFKNSLGGQFTVEGSYVILKKEGRILATLTKNDDEEAKISLPDVKASTIIKVIDYCHCHYDNSISDKEKKNWDVSFVQVKQSVLCELASASYFLDIKPLVNLTSKAIASQISGKSSDEIRETFSNINYETYAPMFASSLAIRARLQRKYNQKQQEVAERLRIENEKQNQTSSEEGNNRNSDKMNENNNGRKIESSKSTSIQTGDENNAGDKKGPSPKSKRKKKKIRKAQEASLQSTEETKSDSNSEGQNEETIKNNEEELNFSEEEPANVDEDDEEFDPERLAELDREVEEFRLRLEQINSQSSSKPKIQLPNHFDSSLAVGR